MERVFGHKARFCAAALLMSVFAGCGGGGSNTSSNSASSGSTNPQSCTPASNSSGPYCLTFIGAQFDIHVGEQFKIAVVAPDGKTVISGQTLAKLPSASFSIYFPQVLQTGVQYYVDYYSDASHDNHCESPPTDHVWRSHIYIDFYTGTITKLPPATGDAIWSVVHDDPWVTDPVGNDTCPQLNQF